MRGRLAVRALVAYLVLRGISALFIALAARDQVPIPMWTDQSVDYLDMTNLWDADWYRTIAEEGYPDTLPRAVDGQVQQNPWAFYPLFPLVCRVVMSLTGLSFPLVGSTIALLCGAGAAVLMVGLLARRVGDRTALLAVAVWAAFPASPSLQISYSEGPAMLVLLGFLWMVARRKWAWAATLAVVMGVTRPIAVPLAVVLAVALFLRWRGRRSDLIPPGEYAVGAGSLLVTGLSGLIWPAVVWRRTGELGGYTDTMASWRIGHVIEPFKPWLTMSQYAMKDTANPATYGPVLLAFLAAALVVAVCGPWSRRLGWELRAWCLAYPAYLVAVLDPFTSLVRYLIPLFPLAVLAVGGAWPRRRPESPVLRAAVFILIGILLQWVWINVLLVFVPPTDYPP